MTHFNPTYLQSIIYDKTSFKYSIQVNETPESIPIKTKNLQINLICVSLVVLEV